MLTTRTHTRGTPMLTLLSLSSRPAVWSAVYVPSTSPGKISAHWRQHHNLRFSLCAWNVPLSPDYEPHPPSTPHPTLDHLPTSLTTPACTVQLLEQTTLLPLHSLTAKLHLIILSYLCRYLSLHPPYTEEQNRGDLDTYWLNHRFTWNIHFVTGFVMTWLFPGGRGMDTYSVVNH